MHYKDFSRQPACSHTHLKIHRSPNNRQRTGGVSPTQTQDGASGWRSGGGLAFKGDEGSGADGKDRPPQ